MREQRETQKREVGAYAENRRDGAIKGATEAGWYADFWQRVQAE